MIKKVLYILIILIMNSYAEQKGYLSQKDEENSNNKNFRQVLS